MTGKDNLSSMQGALGKVIASMPESARQKFQDCEAMRELWKLFPESINRIAAPSRIYRVQNENLSEAFCEIWIEDRIAKEVLLRFKANLLRELAEKLGKTAIENFSFKSVKREKLRELIAAIER